MIKGLLFDLDGVIVDTAKYHYLAWKTIADELGINFTEKENERLKGVSRVRSFEIILEIGSRTMDTGAQAEYCERKNNIYLEYIYKLTADEILPGVRSFLESARAKGYKIALGSASKNAVLILQNLGLMNLFDTIIDGTKVSKAKPDPEVFTLGAQTLNLENSECIVFEDALAGIQAAKSARMYAVAIGTPTDLPGADMYLPGFAAVTLDEVITSVA